MSTELINLSQEFHTTVIYEYYDAEDNYIFEKDRQYIDVINQQNIQHIIDYSNSKDFLLQNRAEIERNKEGIVLHAIYAYCEYKKFNAFIYVQFKVGIKNDQLT